jgi:hypothetical protein
VIGWIKGLLRKNKRKTRPKNFEKFRSAFAVGNGFASLSCSIVPNCFMRAFCLS